MSATVLCANCGEGLAVPGGTADALLRCPACGALRDPTIPMMDDARIQSGRANSWNVSTTPRQPGAGAGTGSSVSDEDDDRPYQIRDDAPTEPCLNCRKPLPAGAALCNHCGFDQNTGEVLRRTFKKVDRQWEAGLNFSRRISIFLAVQGLALAATLVVAWVEGEPVGLLISWLFGVVLLAFVAGTYPRLHLTRHKQGSIRLAKIWRFCFIPLKTADINWRPHEGIVLTRSQGSDFLDWIVLFFLAPAGIIPAILWWHYVVGTEQFDVALARDHGYPAILLYRGHNQTMARDILDTLRSVTGLPRVG